MEIQETLLKEHTDLEKGAYLGAIASLATADHIATDEEIEYLVSLAEAAGLSEPQKESVVRAARELSGEELKRCLEILKDSDLRFSLVTDLIRFAETDKTYSEEEKANVEKIAQYLGVNKEQFNLLDQFVQKTADTQVTPEKIQKPGFLSSLGLDSKFQNAGINANGFIGSLLSVAGPLLMGALAGRGLNSNKQGNLSSLLSSVTGNSNSNNGILSSITSLLGGGRRLSGNGNFLSRIFGF